MTIRLTVETGDRTLASDLLEEAREPCRGQKLRSCA